MVRCIHKMLIGPMVAATERPIKRLRMKRPASMFFLLINGAS